MHTIQTLFGSRFSKFATLVSVLLLGTTLGCAESLNGTSSSPQGEDEQKVDKKDADFISGGKADSLTTQQIRQRILKIANTYTFEELDSFLHEYAARGIVQRRQAHGSYDSLRELDKAYYVGRHAFYQLIEEAKTLPGPKQKTFNVRIENTAASDFYSDDHATGGAIWLTPGAYAVHWGDNPIYSTGAPASSGLEAIAEAGRPGGTPENDSLVQELEHSYTVLEAGSWSPKSTVADPNDPKGSVPGAPPIAPDGVYEFKVAAKYGTKLSFASMYVPSNDITVSTDGDGIPLFQNGGPVSGKKDVSDHVVLLDAGTEVNQQPGWGHLGAPLQKNNGGADAGEEENGVARNIDQVEDGYTYPKAAKEIVQVTVEHTGTVNGKYEFTVRIKNTAPTDFYRTTPSTGGAIWVTPGAYATHTGKSPIFRKGFRATSGLEAIAEAGKPGGTPKHDSLVKSLGSNPTVSNSGAWKPGMTVADPNDPKGSVPGAPPIAPDGAFEFQVQGKPGEKLSFATMFVPSNDIFIAPEGDGISLFNNGTPVDGEVTEKIRLWDAGTERNQKPGFGPLSAPLQKNNGGADAGIREGDTVRPADKLEDGYSYPSASDMLKVTISPAN